MTEPTTRRTLRAVMVAIPVAVFVLAAGLGPPAEAFPRYKDPVTNAGNCSACHGDFTGPISPTGAVFPSDSKHEMHRASSNMNSDCDLCHTSGDNRNPFLGSSNGTNDNVGYGCAGCHGRLEDGGNDGISTGYGAGLRQHHTNSGINACTACHTDASPANYTPVGEDVSPPYYGTVDTNASTPCNTVAVAEVNENWTIGDFLGLDNDGDGDYDGADLDCIGTPGEVSGETLPMMLVTAHNPGTSMTIEYAPACGANDNTIHYGSLFQLSGYVYDGEQCSIGNTGSYVWSYSGTPAATFFVVVGNNGTIEGSYGKANPGGERPPNAGSTCLLVQDLVDRCD